MSDNSKIISVVYKNKHPKPINKQAVKEFFRDHECVAPDFSDKRFVGNVSIKHFKKAVGKLREPKDEEISINLVDYERACISIKKNKTSLPYKYKKLLNYLMYSLHCNRKLAILVVQKMQEERFIKVHGDFVEYF